MKSKFNFRKILFAGVAGLFGGALGFLYVSNLDGGITYAFDESSLRDSETDVLKLYNDSAIGTGTKTVESFSALENFQIAEYKLNNSPKVQKVQYGYIAVDAPVVGRVDQYVYSQKTKIEGKYEAIQLSKSSQAKVMNIMTYTDGDDVVYNGEGTVPTLDTSAGEWEDVAKTLSSTFSSSVYTEQSITDYQEQSKTSPKTIMQFLISSKTITNASKKVEKLSNGNYSISFTANTDSSADGNSYAMACYYVYDIAKTGGNLVVGIPKYNYVEITYEIDSEWNFVKAQATEKYVTTVSIAGQRLSTDMDSVFVEYFNYGDSVEFYVND